MVNTCVISFIPRNSRKSKKGIPIYCRIKIGKTIAEFSTKIRAKEGLWNNEFKRLSPKAEYSDSLNQSLDELDKKLKDLYFEFKGKNSSPISAELLKDIYFGKHIETNGLIALTGVFIKDMDKELAEGSLKNYRYSKRALEKYLTKEYKRKEIPLESISIKFAVYFEKYLKTNTSCTQNGAMKHLQRLKAILNYGIRIECLKYNPLSAYKIKFKKVLPKYLNKHELRTIESASFQDKTLNNTRDFFLLACYTGLSYVEVKNLSKNNIIVGFDDNLWLSATRQKTGTKEEVPLLPKALAILNRYLTHYKETFPIYSNQAINRNLKKLAKLVNLNKNLSYHCGRHTFATTIALANGVPLETLQKVLGHNSIRSTQIYAQIMNEKVANDFAKLIV